MNELHYLAAPIRRRAIEATDGMPLALQRAVGSMLGLFAGPLDREPDHLPTVDGILGRSRQSVQGYARRAGYHQPGYMLRSLRLALAVRMLETGEPVARTAYRLGWSSPQAFGRSFRELTGRTPSQRGDLGWEALVDAALAPITQADLFPVPTARRVA